MSFTVDVDGMPTLSFEVASQDYAEGLVYLDDFREDLTLISCNGMPVCESTSVLQLRLATDAEAGKYRSATRSSSDEEALTFVFLIRVDQIVVPVIQAG